MKRLTLLLTCFFISMGLAIAQNKQVTGVVVDESGEPVIGASVVVKGTTTGTVTDVDGKFSLSVPASATTLVVKYIGMTDKEVAVSDNMQILMAADVHKLDEIVVVAYGAITKEAKTGAVTQINSADIQDLPASSFDKMLAGKMAGVTVTASSGQPGAASDIRIRGNSSINAGNRPLYVIDGIPALDIAPGEFTNSSNALANINPGDIETITVLKDAAATSIYGSRAANGVILVTTKSGKSGATRVGLKAKYGMSQLANDNDYGIMNPQELVGYMRDAVRNAGRNPDDPTGGSYYVPMSLLANPMTNWVDATTRNGTMQEYELSVSGGTGKTKFYTSLSYHDNEGIYYGVDFERMQFRANLDHEINKQFKMGTRINGAYVATNDVPMQNLYYGNPAFASMLILPWTPLYNQDGQYNLVIPENSNTNPVATAKYDDQWSKNYVFSGNIYLSWEPIKGLVLKTTDAMDFVTSEGRRYWSPDSHVDYKADNIGVLQTTSTKAQLLSTSNTAEYTRVFDDIHSFRALVGQEAQKRMWNLYYLYSPGVNPQIPYPNTSTTDQDEGDYDEEERTLMSFFGMIDYNYDSKYYAQLSLRRDGSSVFGTGTKWGTFYSFGLSWNMHNESFLKDVEFLNVLKPRFSYGVTGNNLIGAYDQYGLYGSREYNGISGLAPDQLANPELAWEDVYTGNIGFDFGFFDKLTGSLEFYQRTTKNMLLDVPLSQTSGLSTLRQNIGSLKNKGVELQLNYNAVNTNDWKVDVAFNLAYNKSEILNLGPDEQITYVTPDGDLENRLVHKVGKSFLTYYLFDYAGVNPLNGDALWRTEDGTLTTDFSKARRIYAGSPEPKYTGGFAINASWKGISLDMLLEYKAGNKVLIIENRYLNSDGAQWGTNQAKSGLNYWKKQGDVDVNPRPVARNASSSNSFGSNRYLEKGDYVRIKDITLGYTLPSSVLKKAGLYNAKIYGSALNAFTFHDVNFWDPERGIDGMGYGIYPMTKSFVVGLDLTF